jgi:hypothetical protein
VELSCAVKTRLDSKHKKEACGKLENCDECHGLKEGRNVSLTSFGSTAILVYILVHFQPLGDRRNCTLRT